MKITSMAIAPCVMRKEDPTWRFALGASPTTVGWVVTIGAEEDAF